MYELEPTIDRSVSAPFLTSFHGWHHYSPPLIFSPTAALLLAPNWSLLPFLLFFSVWFIFVVPSFLPFQKVMHTRKRHSELYHELNHSSKFHTIDRYSRDPAMSTFKVRPLPKKRGIGGTRCNLVHPTPLPPPLHPLLQTSPECFSTKVNVLLKKQNTAVKRTDLNHDNLRKFQSPTAKGTFESSCINYGASFAAKVLP